MIPLSTQTYGDAEIAAVLDVMKSGRFTMGERTERFEAEFAEYIGAKHAVMVNSGSSANLLAITALCESGVLAHGDKVMVPALTWSTGVWPVIQNGLVPILVDCDPHTLQMSPEQLIAACDEHPDARAVFLAHIMGNPCDLKHIKTLADARGMVLIEDCCEALGAEWMGMKVGRFGALGTFSFYFSHHITTMEGGMVVTDNGDLADIMRSVRSHGWSRALTDERRTAIEADNPRIDPRFLFVHQGYNLRPMEIQAAMGSVQLKRLPEFNARRAEAQESMREMLRILPGVQPFDAYPEADPAWFAFPVTVQGDRARLMERLEVCGIQTRPIVAGNLAEHPAFKGKMLAHGGLEEATRIAREGLYWGLHPEITRRHIRHLADVLASFFVPPQAAPLGRHAEAGD